MKCVTYWYQFFTCCKELEICGSPQLNLTTKQGPNTEPQQTSRAKINYDSTTTESPPQIGKQPKPPWSLH